MQNTPPPLIVFACRKGKELLGYAQQIDLIDPKDGREKMVYILQKDPRQAAYKPEEESILQEIADDVLRVNVGCIDKVEVQQIGVALVEFLLKEFSAPNAVSDK